MGTISITLEKGLKIGDITHTVAILEEVTAGMVIEATEESEKLISTPDGYQLVGSPALVGINVLRRQIKSIGDVKGPIERSMLNLLSSDDLNRMHEGAAKLELAALAVATAKGDGLSITTEERQVAFAAALDAVHSAIQTARGLATRGRSDPA